jgi:hypothetical protein
MSASPALDVDILRNRLLIHHADPLTREMCVEITLHNDRNESTDEVILRQDTYLPGLRVFDADGSELALLPNGVIRDILSASGRRGDRDLIEEMNAHRVYVFWIKFPRDSELEPHETRVVRLAYTDSQLHEYRWSSLTKCFFNIPEYEVEFNLPDSVAYPNFVSISPPEAHRLVLEEIEAKAKGPTASRDLEDRDHFHIRANGVYIDATIPRVEGHVSTVRMVYGVYPERNEQHLLIGVILGLLIVSLSFLLSMFLLWQEPTWFGTGFFKTAVKALSANALLLGTSLALLAAGFVGLAEGSVFQRTKWWASASGAMAAAGMFFSLVHS